MCLQIRKKCIHTYLYMHMYVYIHTFWFQYGVLGADIEYTSVQHTSSLSDGSTTLVIGLYPILVVKYCIRDFFFHFLHFLNNKPSAFRLEASLEFIASIPNFSQSVQRTWQRLQPQSFIFMEAQVMVGESESCLKITPMWIS